MPSKPHEDYDDWDDDEAGDYDDEDPNEMGQTLEAAVQLSSSMFKELMAGRETIAALTAEVERKDKVIEAARAHFVRLSDDPSVSPVLQQAYLCVVFALDYPDKFIERYEEEPPCPT